jgi:hypothetical protein
MSILHLISKVATRFKASSLEEREVTGGERHAYVDAVWEMYKESYKAIGMHVPSPSGLLDYDLWELFFEGEAPVAFNLYTRTPFGLKTGLLGTDGSPVAKSAIKTHLRSRYNKPGVYGEVSHAVERLTQGVPVVCAIHIPKVLKKTVVALEDGVHYTRNIQGVGVVTKKLVGNPRGIPSGSESVCPIPDRPGEPLSPEDSAKLAFEKLSVEMDLADHASCQLDFDP